MQQIKSRRFAKWNENICKSAPIFVKVHQLEPRDKHVRKQKVTLNSCVYVGGGGLILIFNPDFIKPTMQGKRPTVDKWLWLDPDAAWESQSFVKFRANGLIYYHFLLWKQTL